MSDHITTVMSAAVRRIPERPLFGGIMYLHANIPENFFKYKQAMLISLYLGILLLNSELENVSVSEMIRTLVETKVVGDEVELERYFYDFHNRKFALKAGANNFQIPLDRDLKMLFCRLDISKFDQDHHRSSETLLN